MTLEKIPPYTPLSKPANEGSNPLPTVFSPKPKTPKQGDQFFSFPDISDLFTARNLKLQLALVTPSIIQTEETKWDESQLKLFTKLQEKVEKKKTEFKDLVNSPNGLPEEKLDLERASRRMDSLLELPQSELLRKHPQVFNKYVNDLINNLLEKGPRSLNYILACTEYFDLHSVENSFEIARSNLPKENVSAEKLLEKLLPKWDTTNEFFYLPGFPIVVKVNGISSYASRILKDAPIILKENGASEDDIKKLKEAARLIKESGWLEIRPKTLKQMESISILEDAPFNGMAGEGHAIFVINPTRSPLSIADTIVHEDIHKQSSLRSRECFFFEYDLRKDNTDRPKLNHPWVHKDDPVSNLLNELQSYSGGAEFLLHLWDKGEIDPLKDLEPADTIFKYKRLADKAIILVKENKKYLSDDGQKWLNEFEELWKSLSKRVLPLLDECLGLLLFSESILYRNTGYLATIECYDNTTDQKKKNEYIEQYKKAISIEGNPIILLGQASPRLNKNSPKEFSDIAKVQLQDPDNMKNLIDLIDTITLDEKEENRLQDYFLIADTYSVASGHEVELNKKFKEFLNTEDSVSILKELCFSEDIPKSLKELAQKRFNIISKTIDLNTLK